MVIITQIIQLPKYVKDVPKISVCVIQIILMLIKLIKVLN